MAGTVDQNCPSCGSRHTFLFTAGDLFNEEKAYKYTCPTTNKTAQITVAQWGQVIQHKPKDAVIVREVDRD